MLTANDRYRILAIVTAFFVYLLIVAGAVVRVSGSGLGCPDWPTCHGTMAPPFDRDITAKIEYTHRLAAGLAGVPLVLTVVFAWLSYRAARWIVVPAMAMLALLAIQIPLGGILVILELPPNLVVAHLAIAFSIFMCALTVAVAATRPANPDQLIKGTPEQVRRLAITLAALFILLIIGGVVVDTNTSLACPEWPICNANRGVIFVPPPNLSPTVWFHLAHRYTVALFGLWLGWVIFRTLREQGHIPSIRLWSILLGAAFVLQVSIGAVQVLLQKPAWLRAAHLGVAALVWGSLVVLTLLNYLGAAAPKPADG